MSFLLGNTAVAGVLALLVVAIGRWLRPAPAAMHLLWLLVLLKLAAPPLFDLPLSWPWERPPTIALDLEQLQAAARQLAAGATPTVPELASAAAAGRAAPVAGSGLGNALLGLWAVGTALYTALLSLGIVRGLRRIGRLRPAPAWLRTETESIAARLGVRTPELLDDPAAGSPCIWSLGRVRLLLPVAALMHQSASGRAAVLAHELAHLRRRDHRTAVLELVLAAALWWHPLFWVARAQLRLWAELACDAWAVAVVPGAQFDYAAVLIDAVAAPDSAVPGLTVLAARPAARAAFERRLTMILNEKVRCRASAGFWLPFTALGLGLLATPTAAQDPEKVQIEIRVNGKNVDDLSAEERRSLLQKLLGEESSAKPGKRERRARERGDDEDEEVEVEAPAKKKSSLRALFDRSSVEVVTPETLEEIEVELERAKRLIEDVPEFRGEIVELGEDLKGLGKQLRLLEGKTKILDVGKAKVLDAKGLLQDVDVIELGKGMRVLGEDLRSLEEHVRELDEMKLLLPDGVRLLQQGGKNKSKDEAKGRENDEDDEDDERSDRADIGRIVQRALQDARRTALEEIRGDVDLQRLGITKDVERMVERVLRGKDSKDVVREIVRKAAGSALRDVEQVIRVEDLEGLHDGKARYEIKVLEGGDVPEVKFYEVRSRDDAPAKAKTKSKDQDGAQEKTKVWRLDTRDETPQPRKRKIV